MKRSLKSTFLLAFIGLVIIGCSRKKDSFVSRSWHAIGTEYNILYNGNIALEQGRESLAQSYTDNYWEVLPIERMQVEDQVSLPGQAKNSDFEKAEEKAVKAVQRHSMNIDGKEQNPQIDEAYLLLGKARYYDQRFVPAMEAFNYILFKYAGSDKINQARIWREKANIRLENNEVAIENLKRLMYQEDLKAQDLADATSMLAQAYINTKHIDSAIPLLGVAADATKRSDERGRYAFIQGQLYNSIGEKDSANLAFDKVIELNRRIPRVYLISAFLEKVKNFDRERGNKMELMEHLNALEESRENRPFLDKIYYRIAEFHNEDDSDSIAKSYYNKSLRTNSRDKFLNAMSYQTLGNMNFDNALYSVAGAYYDSTMVNLDDRTRLFRDIRRKKENLTDVIHYEAVAQRNDSILHLVNLPESERLTYFNAYIEDLKRQAEEAAEAAKLAEQKAARAEAESRSTKVSGIIAPDVSQRGSTFYFYNPTTVAYGKNEFVQLWGERQLADNWRWSDVSGGATAVSNELEEVVANATEEELYDPNFYIELIPTEEKQIDSLVKDRNFAYYQLGLIYKDKFKELELAKNKLRSLLNSEPEERLVLPSKYNLFKIYEELGESDEAEIMKNNIISNHPDSRYATILLNPGIDLGEDENDPEVIYANLYEQFEEQEYNEVIEACEKYITMFDGEAIVPKYEFLKAVSRARLFGYESYKEALNFIALNYPNSEEGKRADELIQNVLPIMANNEFGDNATDKHFKAIYKFEDATDEDIETFKKEVDEAIAKVRYFDLSTSVDIYNPNTIFVVVHGMKSIEGALGLADILKEYDEVIDKEHFAISSQNYQIVQMHKNLTDYLSLDK